MARTPDALPVIDAGCGPAGLIFGNLAGAFSGSIVAGIAAGEAPPVDIVPFRHNRFAETR